MIFIIYYNMASNTESSVGLLAKKNPRKNLEKVSIVSPSHHYYEFLNSLKISVNDLQGFTSTLTIVCPVLSIPIRFILSSIVISLLLLEKFSRFFLIQEAVYTIFYSIKRLILNFNQSEYEIIHNQTLTLLCQVRDTIRDIMSQNLSSDLVFTMFTCTELLKSITTIPLELVIYAVNNCMKLNSTIANVSTLPSIYSLFSNEISPFLPQYFHKEYTLVLDLDETLGHCISRKFLLRPGVHQFINEMFNHYELVLFTAASREYADWAMELVDPTGLIKLRLYRQHIVDGSIKDLSMIGRDINKILLIDNFSRSFEKQPDNGIEITSWVGDQNDKQLFNLIKPLSSLPYIKIKNLNKH